MPASEGILIIGTARSGTSAVYKSIANESLYYNTFYEPWHIKKGRDPIPLEVLTKNDALVKTLVHQKPYVDPSYEYRFVNTFDFYKELIPKFRRVVLMMRKNVSDAVISYTHAIKLRDWHREYRLEYDPEPEAFYLYKKWNETIEQLSKEFDINITYYEDLFHSNNRDDVTLFANELELQVKDQELFYSYYDNKNRYRQI